MDMLASPYHMTREIPRLRLRNEHIHYGTFEILGTHALRNRRMDGFVMRAFSGENLFQNIYTARGDGSITFGASFPGKILPVEITPGCDLIAQKRSFLASEQGVELSVFFNKKFMTGFFGGEGFIMQRLSGQGMAFLEIDGALKEFVLEPGQQMIVDTGNVAAFESTVKMEVVSVKGIKNKLLGGEGFFNTVLTGPGKIWLQTLPIAGVAMEIYNLIPHSS